MRKGPDCTVPEAQKPVVCRVCERKGISKIMPAHTIIPHLGGAHADPSDKWVMARYIEEFGDEELFLYQPDTKVRAAKRIQMQEINQERERKKREGLAAAVDDLYVDNISQLKKAEKAFFEEFVDQVFQQLDRDEAQMSVITSLALDMIYSKRLRSWQLDRSNPTTGFDKDFETIVKQTEERIAKAMNSLGISREAQMKRGAILKSTPSAIISAYFDELERMSPEMLDALRLEETRVYAQMKVRIEKHLLSQAPDLADEEESDVAHGAPLSLEQALARANIAVGGAAGSSHTAVTAPTVEPEPILDDRPGADLPF